MAEDSTASLNSFYGRLLDQALGDDSASTVETQWRPPAVEDVAAILPQFEVEALIGHGGMGAVYRARQPALDRVVAVKLLPVMKAELAERFEREARTLARLQHPGIVAIHESGQSSDGHPFFVMEHVDGTTLAQLIQSRSLKPDQALQITIQVCEALHYAHQQGVIHRDIKPANVLVTREGKAKLADFGLARPLTQPDGSLTAEHLVMGTPDYMAPEQRQGVTDARSDIYALGVMLYEMLTGTRPHGVFAPPSQKSPVDARLDEVVSKAMQQEPEKRFQEVTEMQEAVERVCDGEPQDAPRRYRRWPLIFAAVASVTLAAIWSRRSQDGTCHLIPRTCLASVSEGTASITLTLENEGTSSCDSAVLMVTLQKEVEVHKKPEFKERWEHRLPAIAAGTPLIFKHDYETAGWAPGDYHFDTFALTGGTHRDAEGSVRVSSNRFKVEAANSTASSPEAARFRLWTDDRGKSLEAAYRRLEGDHLVLELKGGAITSLPLGRFSAADQDWVRTVGAAASLRTFAGHRYQHVDEVLPWQEARRKAAEMGGHLATVTTAAENDWLANAFGWKMEIAWSGCWLGGVREAKNKSWTWCVDEAFQFQDWLPDEPNSASFPSYLVLWRPYKTSNALKWNDTSDLTPSWRKYNRGFIIEWDDLGPQAGDPKVRGSP